MRPLSEIVAAQTSDEFVLARDFRAFLVLSQESSVIASLPREVIVQTVLERTAIVYTSGRVDDKLVIRYRDLPEDAVKPEPRYRVMVRDEDVKWVPRNLRELHELRARKLGQERGRLIQGKARKVDAASAS